MQSKSPQEVLRESVGQALSASLGRNEARAVEFYVDSSIVAVNPGLYARSLARIFGSGADVLLNAIIKKICENVGLESSGIDTLEACVARARSKWGTQLAPAG